MDASGNAAKNQLKTTKSETATTPMQTAIRIQSRRVKRSIIQEVPSARSPVPSGTDDKRHWVLGTGHLGTDITPTAAAPSPSAGFPRPPLRSTDSTAGGSESTDDPTPEPSHRS